MTNGLELKNVCYVKTLEKSTGICYFNTSSNLNANKWILSSRTINSGIPKLLSIADPNRIETTQDCIFFGFEIFILLSKKYSRDRKRETFLVVIWELILPLIFFWSNIGITLSIVAAYWLYEVQDVTIERVLLYLIWILKLELVVRINSPHNT